MSNQQSRLTRKRVARSPTGDDRTLNKRTRRNSNDVERTSNFESSPPRGRPLLRDDDENMLASLTQGSESSLEPSVQLSEDGHPDAYDVDGEDDPIVENNRDSQVYLIANSNQDGGDDFLLVLSNDGDGENNRLDLGSDQIGEINLAIYQDEETHEHGDDNLPNEKSEDGGNKAAELLSRIHEAIEYTRSRMSQGLPLMQTTRFEMWLETVTYKPSDTEVYAFEVLDDSPATIIFVHPDYIVYELGIPPPDLVVAAVGVVPRHTAQWWVGKSAAQVRAGPWADAVDLRKAEAKVKGMETKRRKQKSGYKTLRQEENDSKLKEGLRRQIAGLAMCSDEQEEEEEEENPEEKRKESSGQEDWENEEHEEAEYDPKREKNREDGDDED
ncbi:hypothetical protein HBI64_180600 [Parastagonospora nodorum]|nr:hypothetical protein HBH52_099690 [Parastagonospora nodorum]KAH6118683.1 hypothetical protein HBI64_180600 [Parastagonospora nodorum]